MHAITNSQILKRCNQALEKHCSGTCMESLIEGQYVRQPWNAWTKLIKKLSVEVHVNSYKSAEVNGSQVLSFKCIHTSKMVSVKVDGPI